ncbi:hypothetical protein BZA77DRAFT_107034 [Pyronema omphalodes]|nr:hypothetical protein BZA77DRAFT_107034 [Pyronema omphalodes]
MDTNDVSGVPLFAQMLERQKLFQQMSAVLKGQRPMRRQSLATLVRDHLQHLQSKWQTQQQQQQYMFQTSFISEVYPPSIAPFKSLSPMFIKDLTLQTQHRGRYILLRTVTPPSKLTAVMTVVEDQNGDGDLLSLYNQDDNLNPEHIIPKNTVCLVKEPYYKTTVNGGFSIRVDHVSDIIFLGDLDSRIPPKWKNLQVQNWSAEKWREHGNSAVKMGNFTKARASYTNALSRPTDDQELLKILNNRAYANLKLGRFEEARKDANAALKLCPTDEKALFRVSQALYELDNFKESLSYLERLLEQYPNNASAQKELSRTKLRIEEEKNGTFNFRQMLDSADKYMTLLDCATFIGPVTIKESKGRGRGVFLTQDVKAGDLLLCEKAFAIKHCFDPNHSISLIINTNTSSVNKGQQANVIAQIVNQLHKNPSKAQSIKKSYVGSYQTVKETEVDGEPIVDSFLAERIVCLNAFGCPISSAKYYRDVKKNNSEPDNAGHDSTGHWAFTAYFNHSCIPNISRSFIGNFIIIRAAKDMLSGEELTLEYVSADLDYKERQKILSAWGFSCDCKLCHADRLTPTRNIQKCAALMENVVACFRNCKTWDTSLTSTIHRLEMMLKLLDDMNATYVFPALEQPRSKLLEPYLAIIKIYRNMKFPHELIAVARMALACQGFEIQTSANHLSVTKSPGLIRSDYLIEIFLHLASAYSSIGIKKYRDDLVEYVRTLCKMQRGYPESYNDENRRKVEPF